MYIRGFILFCLIFLISYSISGQEMKILILEKMGSKHRITYGIGDKIILKLHGEDYELREEITDMTDSTLSFRDFSIPTKNIHYVKTVHTRGFLSPSNGPKIMIAGAVLFLADIVNQTLIQGNDSFELNKGVTIASASMIAFGGLLMTFKYRKFKPGKNKRIRTSIM
jgi:hypothetical protein